MRVKQRRDNNKSIYNYIRRNMLEAHEKVIDLKIKHKIKILELENIS